MGDGLPGTGCTAILLHLLNCCLKRAARRDNSTGPTHRQNPASVANCHPALYSVSASTTGTGGEAAWLSSAFAGDASLTGTLKLDDEALATAVRVNDQNSVTESRRRVSGWTKFDSCGDEMCKNMSKQLHQLVSHKETIHTLYVGAGAAAPQYNVNHSICYNGTETLPTGAKAFPWCTAIYIATFSCIWFPFAQRK